MYVVKKSYSITYNKINPSPKMKTRPKQGVCFSDTLKYAALLYS